MYAQQVKQIMLNELLVCKFEFSKIAFVKAQKRIGREDIGANIEYKT